MDMLDAIKAAGWKANGPDEYTLEFEDPCEYPDHHEPGTYSGRVYHNRKTGLWDIEFEHDDRGSPMDTDTEDHPTAEAAMAAVEDWLDSWARMCVQNMMAAEREQRELEEDY